MNLDKKNDDDNLKSTFKEKIQSNLSSSFEFMLKEHF